MCARLLATIMLTALTGHSQSRDIAKSDVIDALFAKTQKATDLWVKPNYRVSLRAAGEPSSWVTHLDADEIWVVRRGAASLFMGDTNLNMGVRKNDKQYEIGAGDVVNLPRTIAYRIAPAKGRLEYVAVQIFPAERRAQAATGKPRADQPMPDVVPNATIQDTFAKNDRNQPLHTLGAATMNHVIYNGAPGPYEVHLGCDDIYFVRLGSAEAKVDGFLVNAKETSPGELRGTGVYGAREYKIGVGDILCIPRNTFHYMDPGSTKLGYLLLKVWD